MENMFTVVASTLDKVEARVNEINQASAMISTIKSDNAWLETEEKAAILKEFINWSSKLRTTNRKDSDSDLIIGNWMLWYNVESIESWRKIWTIRAFDNDASVVYTPYGSKQNMRLWRLTSQWVVKLQKAQA